LTKEAHTNNKFRQIILLDEMVELVVSDDLIFSTEKLKQMPVEKWFPFIESIFENLKKIKKSDGELIFSRVESPAEFMAGTYDFTFTKIEIEEKSYIKWSIYDYTKVYEYLARYQQLKNEKDIYRQQLEYKSKETKTLSQLLSKSFQDNNHTND